MSGARELERARAVRLAARVLSELAEDGCRLTRDETRRALRMMGRALVRTGQHPDPFESLGERLGAEVVGPKGFVEPEDASEALSLAGAIRMLDHDLHINLALGISAHDWAWARTPYAAGTPEQAALLLRASWPWSSTHREGPCPGGRREEIRLSSRPGDAARRAARALVEGAGVPGGLEVEIVAFEELGGRVVGAVLSLGDEWSIAVAEDRRGEGIATSMVRALIAEGLTGFMVACSEEGAGFLAALESKLKARELEALDVPSWGACRE